MFLLKDYEGTDGRLLRYGQLIHDDRPVTGRALLFIPGLGGSVKGALGFLECLLPFYSPIYAPDLRSFGLNAGGEGAPDDILHHVRDLPDDLEAFHRQVLEPARNGGSFEELTLCGISLGGVLATLLAAGRPERYRRLILLAPAYKPHAQSFPLSYVLRSTLAFLVLGKRARTRLPYGLSALTRNAAILNDSLYRDHPPLVLSPGFLLGVRGLANAALRLMPRLTLPTLMVVPGQDIVCDPEAMRLAYERIPGSTPKQCLEYPEIYHDVLFEAEHPDIARAILRWAADPLAGGDVRATGRQDSDTRPTRQNASTIADDIVSPLPSPGPSHSETPEKAEYTPRPAG
jgi:alpha-beta hydrolase superfamily lysophospholipase